MLLSIIIPVYNEFDKIKNTIKSIDEFVKISKIECEVIVKAVEYCRNFEQFCKQMTLRVVYLHNADSGIYDALNTAFKNSKGEFIYCISCEEIFVTDIHKIIAHLKITTAQMVTTNWLVNDLNNPIWQKKPRKFQKLLLLNASKGIHVCHQSVFIHRNIWVPFRTNFKIIGDQVQIFEIMKFKNPKVEHLELNTIIYKRDGLSSYSRGRVRLEKLMFILTILNANCKWKVSQIVGSR